MWTCWDSVVAVGWLESGVDLLEVSLMAQFSRVSKCVVPAQRRALVAAFFWGSLIRNVE